MIDEVLKVGKVFLPPGTDPLVLWRLIVGFTLTGLVIFAAWSIGTFGSGFAKADETRDYWAQETLERIVNRRKSQCEEPMGSKARAFYAERVSKLVLEYQKLTGTQPEIPDCDEL